MANDTIFRIWCNKKLCPCIITSTYSIPSAMYGSVTSIDLINRFESLLFDFTVKL